MTNPLVQIVTVLAIPVAVGVAAALVSGKGDAKEKKKGAPMGNRREAFRRAFASTGLGNDWLRFLEQTASRESGFNPRAYNGTDGEKAAARKAALKDSVRTQLARAGYLPTQWAFGSKGLFQGLGPFAIVDGVRNGGDDPDPGLRFSPEFIHEIGGPDILFNPGAALAFAMDYADGVSRRSNYTGTWGSLNAGWGWPGRMGDASYLAQTNPKAEARAADLGWERGWTSKQVGPIPRFTQSQLEALARAATFAYEKGG